MRTAGITNPIGGLWDHIHDLDGLRAHAERERSLGYCGLHAIHPSHVPIINTVFSPTAEEVAYWQGLVDAVEAGQQRGTASGHRRSPAAVARPGLVTSKGHRHARRRCY